MGRLKSYASTPQIVLKQQPGHDIVGCSIQQIRAGGGGKTWLDKVVNDIFVEAPVDFNAKEFDLDFEGASAAQFNAPEIDFGTNTEKYNVEDLLRPVNDLYMIRLLFVKQLRTYFFSEKNFHWLSA